MPGPPSPEVGKAPPTNGTIFERLNAHGISWRNDATNLPQVALFQPVWTGNPSSVLSVDHFFADAAAGSLPSFALVDPDFLGDGSEENLLDSLDLDDAPPNFLDPPSLAAAPGRSTGVEGSPGRIPPGADPT